MSSLRRYFLFLVLGLVGSGGMKAQEPVAQAETAGKKSPLTVLAEALPERNLPELDALLTQALDTAPSVLISRWREEQAAENALAARAPMLPNASAYVSGGMIYEQRDDGGVTSDRTLAAVLYNVGVSQPVFHWGALKKNYQVAQLARAISERNAEETRRLLAVDLRRRYFDLVLATGSLEQAKKNLAEFQRQLEFAKKQVEDGFAASGDSGLIQSQITVTEIAIERLGNDRDTLARNLARLAGVTVEQLPAAVVELPKPAELAAVVKALSPAAPAEPSARLQNAEDNVRMESLRYRIEKTRLKPKLGVSLSVSQDNRNPDNNALGPKALITSWNAFATVNWQLFDGFSARSAQRASLARLRSYEQDREQLLRQEADERRAEVGRLQLSWRLLEQSELSLSGARGSVTAIEKDVAAGWVPESDAEYARQLADAALQATNAARAEFYTTLATFFSNRGLDPVLEPDAP